MLGRLRRNVGYIVLTVEYFGWRLCDFPVDFPTFFPKEYHVIPIDRIKEVKILAAEHPGMAVIEIHFSNDGGSFATLCFEVIYPFVWVRGFEKLGLRVSGASDWKLTTLRGLSLNLSWILILFIYFICGVGVLFGGFPFGRRFVFVNVAVYNAIFAIILTLLLLFHRFRFQ